jgi:peptide chain release factor 1
VDTNQLVDFINSHDTKAIDARIVDIEKEFINVTNEYQSNSSKIEEYNKLKNLRALISKTLDVIEEVNIIKELHNKNFSNYNPISNFDVAIEAVKQKISKLQQQIDEINKTNSTNLTLEFDDLEAIIEVRPGVGGEESSLFAQEIMRSYQLYFNKHNIKHTVISNEYSDNGVFKEGLISLDINGAYGKFRFESGIFRVQRIPKTESNGRIHTSTISFLVFPFFKENSQDTNSLIKLEDIKIDVYRSSGPGGQSVNTTDSAVRIKHLPTGITVSCQNGKSQHQNKEMAMRILKSKLIERLEEEKQSRLTSIRNEIFVSNDRSSKIRTFNFPQSRVTDHRIETSWFNIHEIMEGELEEIIFTTSNTIREQLTKQRST